jgi:hypothetical protein
MSNLIRANILCPTCGNPRHLLNNECRFCGDQSSPEVTSSRPLTYTINLEHQMPTVDEALDRFDDELRKVMHAGFKVIKVIHGHGSSGVGGNIRRAFRDAMEHNRWGHFIREVYYGEELSHNKEGLSDLQKNHPSLKKQLSRDVFGNAGITLLIMERI